MMGFSLHNLLFNYIPSATLITKPLKEYAHSNLKLKMLLESKETYLFDNIPEDQIENMEHGSFFNK